MTNDTATNWRETYAPGSVEPSEPSPFRAAPRPFAAAHSGLCVACEDGFAEGELIVHAPGGWAHAVCPRRSQQAPCAAPATPPLL